MDPQQANDIIQQLERKYLGLPCTPRVAAEFREDITQIVRVIYGGGGYVLDHRQQPILSFDDVEIIVASGSHSMTGSVIRRPLKEKGKLMDPQHPTLDFYPFKNSSQKAQYAYDAKRQVLVVEFSDGAQYEYPNVTPEQFATLDQAPFTGKYFHSQFRNNADHPATKIRPATPKLPEPEAQHG